MINNKFKTTPYAHQLACLNKHGDDRAFALLAEMGTGKTWIIINNIADLWGRGELDSVLIFAPSGVHTNWTHIELSKHMPDWVNYYAAPWIAGAKKAQKEALEKLFLLPKDGQRRLRILTMNWEALQSKRGVDFAHRFAMTAGKMMIVCDESDNIKNPDATRTKALMGLRPHARWRRIMTGTPVNNSPFDLFSQFSFLNENILETTSYYAFKAEYAEMLPEGNPLVESIIEKTPHLKRIKKANGTVGNFVPQIVAKGKGKRPKYRNLDKLSSLIDPFSFRVLKSECLDLPKKIYKNLVFEMTPKQAEIYKKAKEECRLVFEGNETPFNKLVAVTKLSQITSGYYIHPASEAPVRIEGDNPKLELLIDRVKYICNNLEQSIIIWARYRAEIEYIVSTLKQAGFLDSDIVEYHGGIDKNDRVDGIDRFQSKAAKIFVGNQQAGGTGITLTAASFVIYFSNNFSLRERLQSEDRAHRIGQQNDVVYYNIVASGTIDEVVIAALEAKKDVADEIIDRGLSLFQ